VVSNDYKVKTVFGGCSRGPEVLPGVAEESFDGLSGRSSDPLMSALGTRFGENRKEDAFSSGAVGEGDEEGNDEIMAVRSDPGEEEKVMESECVRKPQGFVVDKDTGNMYFSDSVRHVIIMMSKDGRRIRTVGGGGGHGGGINSQGFRDGAGAESSFAEPRGMALGPDGALYIADAGNHAIRRIRIF